MCGISGIYKFNSSVGETEHIQFEKGLGQLHLRGPDKKNYTTLNDKKVYLGHTRLSILDLSNKANQPMATPDGRYHITYNGEVYNYRQLKKKYLSDVKFQSSSDTEVVLNLYAKLGKKCLPLLNGFFAFCLYDKLKNEMILARDRMGIKPLFYSRFKDSFYFASELKSFLGQIDKEVDHQALQYFLKLGYIPAPHSILKNVYKLLPGHIIKVAADSLETDRYDCDTDSSPKEVGFSSLYELLDDSVKLRLHADVPVGAFLSGGLDSSIVVALASKYRPDLMTFSLGFKDNTFFDETHYAEAVAKKFGTNHTTFKIDENHYLENLDSIINYFSEPFGDSSALAFYILAKEMKKHVTVALSGDGADEVFGGYKKYRGELLVRKYQSWLRFLSPLGPILNNLPKGREGKLSNTMRLSAKMIEAAKYSGCERYLYFCSFVEDDLVKNLLLQNAPYHGLAPLAQTLNGQLDNFNRYLENDINFVLPGDMLAKVDLMSMANSLEVRVPFLDHRVVEMAKKIESSNKVDTSRGKIILQEGFKDILPSMIYGRPKQGFSVPLEKWFCGSLFNLIGDEVLSSQLIKEQNIFKVDTTNVLLNDLKRGKVVNSFLIWNLITFQRWYRNYFRA